MTTQEKIAKLRILKEKTAARYHVIDNKIDRLIASRHLPQMKKLIGKYFKEKITVGDTKKFYYQYYKVVGINSGGKYLEIAKFCIPKIYDPKTKKESFGTPYFNTDTYSYDSLISYTEIDLVEYAQARSEFQKKLNESM